MALIIETIVTTISGDGDVHIAPLGLIARDNYWIIAPYAPSRTLENLRCVPFAVANHTDDVRVFAGCLTGRRDWPYACAEKVKGVVLDGCVSHMELSVVSIEEDPQRPRFVCKNIHEVAHRPWSGFNRSQAAVLECAVLVSRLKMLTRKKVETELTYLEIAVSKTAGPREEEAWGWLMEKVDVWRTGQDG